MPIKKEEKQENDIETEMAGIKRRETNTNYHKLHAEELKEKRRLKFLENQQKKLEKLKQSNLPFFTRKCPSCDTTLYHTNIRNLNNAITTKRVCKHCAFKSCNSKPPHNKGIYKRTEKERKNLNRYRQLKINFGITEKEYVDMFNLQQGKCKICNTHRNKLNENLFVDHCHKSNKIRGLLCRKCNAGLGIFKDNTDIINSALKYLQSYQ